MIPTFLTDTDSAPAARPDDADQPDTRDDARPPPSRYRRAARVRRAATVPVLADGTLKLMLILLAFFVYLHSRSSFTEERVSPILESLAIRFAGTGAEGTAFATAASHLDPAERLRRRLVGHLPISAAAIEVTGALMAFELDGSALFDGDPVAVRREQLVLLHRLASALGRSDAGQGAELTVTTAPSLASEQPSMTRFATLRRVLAAAGIDTERLRFGFADLPTGRWRFTIRLGDHHGG
jgi:hypothetical protein